MPNQLSFLPPDMPYVTGPDSAKQDLLSERRRLAHKRRSIEDRESTLRLLRFGEKRGADYHKQIAKIEGEIAQLCDDERRLRESCERQEAEIRRRYF